MKTYFTNRALPKLYHKVFNELEWGAASDATTAQVFLPKTRGIQRQLRLAQEWKTEAVIGFPNIFQLVGKNAFWINLSRCYGLKGALDIHPLTFILSSSNDHKALRRHLESGYPVLLKNNKQKRKGLALVGSYKELCKMDTSNYLVAQEIISESLKIAHRRFHIRYYVAISWINGILKCHFHPIGKCVYALPGDAYQLSTWVTRNEYFEEGLPALSSDLDFLENLDGVTQVLKKSLHPFTPLINKEIDPQKSYFDLLGVDLLFTPDHRPMVIEYNRAPAMKPTSDRDKVVKHEVLQTFLGMVDEGKRAPQGWIEIL